MINSVLLYLFIIALISTSFGYLRQVSSFKAFASHLYVANLIFFVTILLSYFGVFAHTEEIRSVQRTVVHNLLPALFFLSFIDLDIKSLMQGRLGCSCSIGPKRYWFILLLSFLSIFLAQFIALHVTFLHPLITASLSASFLGYLLSFTPVKNINGIKEVAATMLYLLAAIAGSFIL